MFAVQASRFKAGVRRKPATVVRQIILGCALGLWFSPASVFAQNDADRATARALAEEGYNALKAQKFDVADDRFRRADALIHAPTLVVDDGRALIGLGRYVEAQERFELVLREGVADNAPAVWKVALQDAAKLLEEVKPKVAWLTIAVPNVRHPLVKIEGRPISAAAIGVKLATNPGTQSIEVSADGYETKQQSITLTEGGEQSLEVSLTALSPQNAPGTSPPATPLTAPMKDVKGPNRTPAYVAFGVGGAGIAVGAITGILALQKRSDLNGVCSNGICPHSAESNLNSYHSLGLVSGIGFAVGIAGAATGFVLLRYSGGKNEKKGAQSHDLQLQVAPGSLRVQGQF